MTLAGNYRRKFGDDAVDVADQLICEVESAIDDMLERVEYANTQMS